MYEASYQFLVLILHVEPGRDTVPGVQEGPALSLLRQVVNEETDQVHGQEDEYVGGELLPAVHQRTGGVHQADRHHRVQYCQHQRETSGNPAPENSKII